MADANGWRPVPAQFWRELSTEEGRKVLDNGLTKQQIRRIYELQGLDPETAPDRLQIGFAQEDIERLCLPRPGGPTLDEWLRQRRGEK